MKFITLVLLILFSVSLPSAVLAADSPKHETYLERLQTGIIPPDLVKETSKEAEENKDLFFKSISFVQSAAKRFLGFQLSAPSFLVSRSKIQSQSSIPQDIKPTIEPNFVVDGVPAPDSVKQIRGASIDLGDKTGVYSVDCPEDIKQIDRTDKAEYGCYGSAWFPKEYNPFPAP